MKPETLTKWRVPLGWVSGVLALLVADPNPRLYGVGLGLAAVGEALRLWASGNLDKNERLSTRGPYAWTRNPLYLGSLIIGVGFSLATGRLALLGIVVVLFAAVYGPVMKREAARLEDAFPEVFPDYAEKVPLFWPRWPRESARGEFRLDRIRRNREHWTVVGWIAVALFLGWKLL